MERHTDGQAYRWKYILMDRHTDERHTDGHTYRWAGVQMDRYTDGKTYR
jgi:YD repeat-containing protein